MKGRAVEAEGVAKHFKSTKLLSQCQSWLCGHTWIDLKPEQFLWSMLMAFVHHRVLIVLFHFYVISSCLARLDRTSLLPFIASQNL